MTACNPEHKKKTLKQNRSSILDDKIQPTEHADQREIGTVRAGLLVDHQGEPLLSSGRQGVLAVREAAHERGDVLVVCLSLLAATRSRVRQGGRSL